MLRRTIENNTKQFGMCMYSERTAHHYTEYGCMLEIKNYQFTRDGRAILSTVGGRRFRVIKSSTRDGYNVAQVEWIKDVRAESEQDKNGKFLRKKKIHFFLIFINKNFLFLLL